jgi:hypothetical protein
MSASTKYKNVQFYNIRMGAVYIKNPQKNILPEQLTTAS